MDGQNKENPEPLNFCFNCGSQMRRIFKFCPNCGQKALARLTVEPPSKVTPISPVAREAVAEFEARLAELRMKKAKKKTPHFLLSKNTDIGIPNIPPIAMAVMIILALLYLISLALWPRGIFSILR